jgi:hypothetical protein
MVEEACADCEGRRPGGWEASGGGRGGLRGSGGGGWADGKLVGDTCMEGRRSGECEASEERVQMALGGEAGTWHHRFTIYS